MSHLTLQEVIERINGNQFSREGPANHGQCFTVFHVAPAG